MQKHFIYSAKAEGDELSHTEWNNLAQDVDAAVDAINQSASGVVNVTDETESGGDPTVGVSITSGVSQVGSPKVIELTKKKKGVNTTLTAENNINVEPRESVGTTKGGNISFKPGDDIEFCSHHRLSENQDEVSVKVIDGDDNPVKLQLNASEMTLTTKDKLGENSNVFDININSGKNTKGYLKVRAQAIDLRCEDHGGIAIQPKGVDGQGYENKIKFEHGGGDGLEFATFNTQHTSIYTDDYRFNKDGIIRLAERFTEVSDKADVNDSTTAYKYIKNNSVNNAAKASSEGKTFNSADDFYDFIDSSSPTCTWKDLIEYIYWAKNNCEGPFTLTRRFNKQIQDLRDSNGKIHISFPESKSPTDIQEFIDNIVSIKAKLSANSSEIYTLNFLNTTTTPPQNIETAVFGKEITTDQGIQIMNETGLLFTNVITTTGGSFVSIEQTNNAWYIVEIEYNK